jgi:threonine/homoserine/homoserine lactone efflux protein
VFYLAFLPQFLPPGGGWFPALELAVTAAATVMCWYVLVALIIVAIRRFLTPAFAGSSTQPPAPSWSA